MSSHPEASPLPDHIQEGMAGDITCLKCGGCMNWDRPGLHQGQKERLRDAFIEKHRNCGR